MSIGEAIDGPEKMISNPFLSESLGGGQASQQWEVHRQQVRERGRVKREGARESGREGVRERGCEGVRERRELGCEGERV